MDPITRSTYGDCHGDRGAVTTSSMPIAFIRERKAIPAHKPIAVRTAIEVAVAELRFLPPYSPDFNPIEMAFSKLKTFLKKTAARTVDDLWDAIAQGIDTFTPTECENYFAAAGYDRK